MKFKALLDDDDAVSPVIGVILMVAITVILAAVIATFVLGLGDNLSASSPQATFEANYDGEDLTITHNSGQPIPASEMRITGNKTDGNEDWHTVSSVGEDEDVTAGASAKVKANEDDTVRLIWEDSDSGTTSTLYTWPN